MPNNYIKKSNYTSVYNYRLIGDEIYISDENKMIYKLDKDGSKFVITEELF